MAAPENHRRFLDKTSYFVPLDVPGLTEKERRLLVRFGHWLEALAKRILPPITPEQQRFVEVAGSQVPPESDFEHAWVKLQDRLKQPRHGKRRRREETPGQTAEIVLAKLRGLVARKQLVSSFADDVLNLWDARKSLSSSQMKAVRRMVAQAERRGKIRSASSGQSRKPGSHRWTHPGS